MNIKNTQPGDLSGLAALSALTDPEQRGKLDEYTAGPRKKIRKNS